MFSSLTSTNFKLFCWALAAAFLLSACHIPREASGPALQPGAIDTAAAETLEVHLTAAAAEGLIIHSATPAPVTSQPQVESNSGTPEPAQAGSPEPEADPCNRVRFIKDVTVPDNTDLQPGEEFTKTWRLENIGTCSWTEGYSLVFERGDLLSGPSAIPISVETIDPGETVDISVDLVAPSEQGSYQGFWKLRTARGRRFGIGEESEAFWLKINVVAGSDLLYDFNRQADEAVWGSGELPVNYEGAGEKKLTFGAELDPERGLVTLKNDQRLEGGDTSGWVLEMQPPEGESRYLVGRFPAYQVKPGDRLTGRVGLIKNPGGPCGSGDVTYQIDYELEGNSSQPEQLWEGQQVCDGILENLDLDLDFLAGDEVRFFLVVIANTGSAEHFAVWDSLSVVR
jgi:hypothetical protein